jgi:type 1 glutamine amidotransferase
MKTRIRTLVRRYVGICVGRHWLRHCRAVLFLFACLAGSSALAADKARVLLVTGVDYPSHQWRETAPTLQRILEEDQRLDVRIVEDPHFLDSAALTNYATVLLHFQNWEVAGPNGAARENLRRYVENGGGLMSVHFACGAWHGEWPEFQNIVGRVWRGLNGSQHDPRGPFKVQIVDNSHPATQGLSDFETDDELYTCLVGDAPIHLLARAKSAVDKQEHPIAFVREYGKGRIFLTTLGHDVKAFTNSCVPQLLRQGCAWTAKQ